MKKNPAFLGAAFLMATSAIGPGFLTQTSFFTQELAASFGFVILISILLDIAVQVNLWSIISVTGQPAQDIANRLLPGLGYFLAALIGFGGLIFNIGNIGGTGLGLNVLIGISPQWGAVISCILALTVFWYREAARLMDIIMKTLGILMIGLTVYVAVVSKPPLREALHRTILPARIDFLTIVTIVGGSVGGYICFAGAHRLLEAGISGKNNQTQVRKSAVTGILITSFMRFVLFLAALGVVSKGITLFSGNPAASVFRASAGELGYRFFGIVLWIAAITSVIGASYTSISFWKSLSPFVRRYEKVIVSCFIVISTVVFCFVGQPARLLIFAGAVNGFILPVALAVILIAASKKDFITGYRHPVILHILGWTVVLVMGWMGLSALL